MGIKNDRLFACLLIMGRLSLDKSEWSNFVTQLEALVEQYDEVNLECLGFPANWQTVLRKQRSLDPVTLTVEEKKVAVNLVAN